MCIRNDAMNPKRKPSVAGLVIWNVLTQLELNGRNKSCGAVESPYESPAVHEASGDFCCVESKCYLCAVGE